MEITEEMVNAAAAAANREQLQVSLIARLLDVWKKYPELRLGQLIGNVYHYPSGNDPYHVPDKEFISSIQEYYKQLNEIK
jgi:hypothetical protein